jgi:hypothetical protein
MLNEEPPPINPNTRMNTSGKAKAKNIAEGVFNIACKLAFIRERIACALLYVDIVDLVRDRKSK